MNTEEGKKQFIVEYDSEVESKAKCLGFKDLVKTNNGFYESLYNKVNFRMIEMFSKQNENYQEFDIEDVSLETEYIYIWKSIYIPDCTLELTLTTEQYLDLLQSSVTKSNQIFLAYLDRTINYQIEKEECEQEDCCLVKQPSRLHDLLYLMERIANINYNYGIRLRTIELEEEINTIIKQREF